MEPLQSNSAQLFVNNSASTAGQTPLLWHPKWEPAVTWHSSRATSSALQCALQAAEGTASCRAWEQKSLLLETVPVQFNFYKWPSNTDSAKGQVLQMVFALLQRPSAELGFQSKPIGWSIHSKNSLRYENGLTGHRFCLPILSDRLPNLFLKSSNDKHSTYSQFIPVFKFPFESHSLCLNFIYIHCFLSFAFYPYSWHLKQFTSFPSAGLKKKNK